MGRPGLNLTTQSLKVLRPFLENPNLELAGVDVIRSSRLASGTAYPIMLRLERLGLLTSRWEEGDPAELGRPRRRYYTITASGVAIVNHALAELSLPNAFPIPEAM
jgi:PadR family transcriptional regulator, regulatory protein PadR